MKNFPEMATELFKQGDSCSQAMVKAAYNCGIINKNTDIDLLYRVSSAFSGAMGTHECLCGAVAGAQIVLGAISGRTRLNAEFIRKFREKRKTTCCRVLKGDCVNIVQECALLLENLIQPAGSIKG